MLLFFSLLTGVNGPFARNGRLNCDPVLKTPGTGRRFGYFVLWQESAWPTKASARSGRPRGSWLFAQSEVASRINRTQLMLTDKKIYQLHSWLGLAAGFFLLIISLTGVILVYEDEIHELTGRDLVLDQPAATALPFDRLQAAVRRAHPQAQLVSARLYASQPDKAVRFEIRENDQSRLVYLNRATGAIVAETPNEDVFFRTTLDLHKSLLAGLPGGLFMGFIGLCLLGSSLTGLWYYRRQLLQPFSLGVRVGKKARVWNGDLHKLLGVLAVWFLLLMSATGVFFHWEELEKSLESGEEKAPQPVAAPASAAPADYAVDTWLAAAQQRVPGFRPEIVSFPKNGDEPLRIRGNRPESVRLLGKFNSTVEVDLRAGQLSKVEHAEDADAEWKAEHLAEQLHFGRFGGWLSKLLWALGGIALGALVQGLVANRKAR